jgi:hypothetical protein
MESNANNNQRPTDSDLPEKALREEKMFGAHGTFIQTLDMPARASHSHLGVSLPGAQEVSLATVKQPIVWFPTSPETVGATSRHSDASQVSFFRTQSDADSGFSSDRR